MREEKKRQFFTRRDGLLFALLAVIALAAYLLLRPAGERGAVAEIYVDDKLVKTVSLDRDGTFPVPGREEVILQVQDGAIRFIQSSCPDKVCIRSGQLRHGGDWAACLPNRVLVQVTAEGGADMAAG